MSQALCLIPVAVRQGKCQSNREESLFDNNCSSVAKYQWETLSFPKRHHSFRRADWETKLPPPQFIISEGY